METKPDLPTRIMDKINIMNERQVRAIGKQYTRNQGIIAGLYWAYSEAIK